MKKISKKVREEAIEACLLAADWWNRDDVGEHPISRRLVSHRVSSVAFATANAAGLASLRSLDVDAEYLEAAALLRDGWSPGDPVRLRGAK